MSSTEAEWPFVKKVHIISFTFHSFKLHKKFPGKIILAFGVHPWYAHQHLDHETSPNYNWVTRLAAELKNHKSAIIGEIGLDKIAKVNYTFNIIS
jgi:Tat protein secretion system quality control protein TatD with DNase activity